MGAGIGSAMIFVLFTYGGWNDAAYISAEVRDRERNMARALLLAIGLVTVLYLLVNTAHLRGLGFDAMARSKAVAADLLKAVWGPTGEKLIAIMIAIAALTSVQWLDDCRHTFELCVGSRLADDALSRTLGRSQWFAA